MITMPGVAISVLASVLSWFGIAIVSSSRGSDAAPARRGYATIAAALAASKANILVLPGTYAENVTVTDGVRVILLGATVGTGAGAAVAISSGSATVGGWGTLSATAAISASTGAYLTLGPEVDVSGTISGVYRVGRCWHVQSGDDIATYLPADGSVISDVAEGDLLLISTTDIDYYHMTRVTIGGTAYWRGPLREQRIQYRGYSNGGTTRYMALTSTLGDNLYLDGVYGRMSQAAASATDYFDFSFQYDGSTLASWTTKDEATTVHELNTSIDTVIDLTDADGSNYLANPRIVITETGSQTASYTWVLRYFEVLT